MNGTHANRGIPFERALESQHATYRRQNQARIVKVPTDVIPGGRTKAGKPVFRRGPKTVDFLGELAGGKAIAIEAKETSERGRFPFSMVTRHQTQWMREWTGVGLLLIHSKIQRQVYGVSFAEFIRSLDAGHRSMTWRRLRESGATVKGYDWLSWAVTF